MFKFDHSQVRFQRVKFKRVSTALSGSATILDEEHFASTGKEKFHKIDIPMSLARMFKVKHKITQFMIPHEGLIMWYGDKVISIEKAPLNERFTKDIYGNDVLWNSNIEFHYEDLYNQQLRNDLVDWYFDGTYMYNFYGEDLKGLVNRSEHLDSTGQFRSINCQSIHLTYLNFKPHDVSTRTCVAMVVNEDVFSISAPIWKAIEVKARLVNSDDEDVNERLSIISSFKNIDKQIAVNLNFALRAAKELANEFGYESIQPLQLPKMMLQLKTVNVPRLPKEVKATTDIGLKLTHGLAWLLGLQYRSTTLDQYMVIRQLIKYMLTKGYFWKDKTKKNKIMRHSGITEIPLIDMKNVDITLNQLHNDLAV
jgi:hypothetical protein